MSRQLRSTIDWNEIVPLLPKAKRDDLYLEAVTLLSGQADQTAPQTRYAIIRKKNAHYRKRLRLWNQEHPNDILAQAGRKFIINKKEENVRAGMRSESGIGRIWKHLKESNNSTITYEGIASLAKGQKMTPAGVTAALWAKGYIDIQEVNSSTAG